MSTLCRRHTRHQDVAVRHSRLDVQSVAQPRLSGQRVLLHAVATANRHMRGSHGSRHSITLHLFYQVDGYLDMSSCSDGAPIAMSQVHFLNGHPSLLRGVEGLAPDPAKHVSYLDIEPVSTSSTRVSRPIRYDITFVSLHGFASITLMIADRFRTERGASYADQRADKKQRRIPVRLLVVCVCERGPFVCIIRSAASESGCEIGHESG